MKFVVLAGEEFRVICGVISVAPVSYFVVPLMVRGALMGAHYYY